MAQRNKVVSYQNQTFLDLSQTTINIAQFTADKREKEVDGKNKIEP
jgi:hypothetical protein